MLRLHMIPWSTNVERVALALAHKGLEAEPVEHDAGERAAIVALSGQELVPVLEDDGRVVADSTAILEYLDERYPERPLYPQDPARRTEMRVFVDWFNRVWKRPPNLIADELLGGSPDAELVDALSREMAAALDWFEALLDRRDFLLGDELAAADVAAFPFLKYAVLPPSPGDDEVFHHVLHDHQRLGDRHGRLRAWIARVDALPRAAGVERSPRRSHPR